MTKQKFGTEEWSGSTENIMKGCPNDCLYCFAKTDKVSRWKTVKLEDWPKPVLNQKALSKKIGKRDEIIMFPSTHDLIPEYLTEIKYFIHKLLSPGNQVLIVSKPRIKVIEEICQEFKNFKQNILFRFTIGSAYDDVLKFWEPGAPIFDERYHSLIHAFQCGYQTSVSCEPMLDAKIDDVIDLVSNFVTETIWLGKMNFSEKRIRSNTSGEILDLVDHLQVIHTTQSDSVIRKLYETFKSNPKIRFKESIMKVIDKG